jgi:predicted 3-demethylubiquinone-9 3-methyltransferase (glyoxalase superfamily)
MPELSPIAGGRCAPGTRRLPFRQAGRCDYRGVHGNGHPCVGLNGGSASSTEAFSFQVSTVDQAETDRLWEAIVGNGGEASVCGWCKDKWGISWQITPHPHRSHRPP